MAWGAASKSCDALLKRVEANDPTLVNMIVLPIKTFGDADVERLARALKHNTHLQSLSASGHKISASSLQILGPALAAADSSSGFQRLAIGDKTMGNEGVIALCSGGTIGKLQGLDLAYKNITSDGDAMKVLGQACCSTHSLVDLNLSRNPIGTKGIQAFCQAAAAAAAASSSSLLPNLETLSLMECEIGALDALAEFVVQTGCITLGLSSNPIGSSSSSCWNTLLHQGNIQSLHLKSCQLGDEGLALLCNAAAGGSIKMLDLSDNGIHQVKALADSLLIDNGWPALTELRLAQNNEIDSMADLATVLQDGGCPLESLDVSKTDCSVADAVSLATTRLHRLRLFGNQLGSEGFLALADLLPTCRIAELDLGGNDADAASVVKLLEPLLLLKTTLSLKVLEIGGNSSSMEIEDLILRILKVHPGLDIARDKPRGEDNDDNNNN